MTTTRLTKKQLEWLKHHNKTHPIKCKMCNNFVKWQAPRQRFGTYCSSECSKRDKQSQVLLAEQTFIKKYGATNPNKCEKIKQKKRQTCLDRYGVHTTLLDSAIRTRQQQTCVERYGHSNPFGSSIVQDKIKQTNLERYGGHPRQVCDTKEKQKRTCFERYGVDNPLKLSNVRDKIKQTNLEKYGSHHPKQSHMVDILPLLGDHDWLFDQYITQNKSSIQIANELGIGIKTVQNYLHEQEIQIKQTYWHSYKSIQWLDSIMEQDGIFIQHALNGGEYQIPGTRYRADGYCEETNTVYEFHGDYWHGNPLIYESDNWNKTVNCTMGELYQKTINREQLIRDLGYNLEVKWETEQLPSPV